MRTHSPHLVPWAILSALLLLAVNGHAQGVLEAPHHNVISPSIIGCLDCHDLTATGWPKFIPEPYPGWPARDPDVLENENTPFNLKCWECHSGNTIITTGGPITLENKETHSSLSMASTKYGEWAAGCTVCHNAHSQGGQPGGKFIWNFARLDQIEVYGAKAAKSGKKTMVFNGPTGPNSFADGDATYDGICEVCHTETVYHQNNAGGDHAHYAGQLCTNCHSHASGFKPGVVCLDCHSNAVNARAAVGTQFSGNSHHIQGVALSSEQCYQCHWEADINGEPTPYHTPEISGSAVDLVIRDNNNDGIADPRPGIYTPGTTAIQYTAGASTALDLNPHCLGCHNDDYNNYTTGGGIFGDGKAPNQYAWDGTSVDARYSQPNSTTWGKYTTTANAAQKNINKAYSAHGNAAGNGRGWDAEAETAGGTGVDGIIPDTSGSVSVACFDCHNAHGSSASGITTSYDNLFAGLDDNGGILKDTNANIGGYSVDYQPQAGGSDAFKNKHNAGAALCFDCHLTPDGSAAGKPWGYQATYEANQAIIGYYDSEFLLPGGAGTQKRYPYKDFSQNAGGHFGASSSLYSTPMHSINGLCTPCHDPHGISPEAVGTCSNATYNRKTTCENNAGTWSSTQQYGVPLLKGTWLTSPYKEDAAPLQTNLATGRPGYGPSQRSDPGYHIDQNTFANWNFAYNAGITENVNVFAGLCLKCHTNDGSNADIDPDGGAQSNQWGTMDRVHETVKGWGSGAKHKFSCSKCHSPHNGSALPRLMVTNCLDFNHRGRVASSGYPTSIPFYSRSGSSGGGSGSGQFPGGGSGSGGGYLNGPFSYSYNFGGVSCHDSVNGAVAWPYNQLWNEVTPWTDTPPAPPTLSSPTAATIGATSATLGATITYEGGKAITDHGTVWSESSIPTENPSAEGAAPRGVFNSVRSPLPEGTKIYYRGYAANSAGTGYSPQGSFYTEPAAQASGINFSAVTATRMTINWTRGSGDGVIVLMKQLDPVSSAGLTDGLYTAYTANSLFGYGTNIGGGNFVVYKGSGNSIEVSGLSPGVTYYVGVYEHAGMVDTSGLDLGTNYNKAASVVSNTTTTAGFSQTFYYVTDSEQTLTIPAGATNILFTAKGAGGGGGRFDDYGNDEPGENGHSIIMHYGDTASDLPLKIYVSRGGQPSHTWDNGGAGGGWGYNPGFFGENGAWCDATEWAFGGAGGGGSSAIIINDVDATLLLEAAGGNGGRADSYWSNLCDDDMYGGAGGAGCGGCTDYSSDPAAIIDVAGGGAGGNNGTSPTAGGYGQVRILYDCIACP